MDDSDHPIEGSAGLWKHHLVMPQAVPMRVTLAGAQWLCLVPQRWQRKALLWAKLYHLMITNQGSATESLT
jgi:hypothetical protein